MTLGMSPTRFDLMVNGREKFNSTVYSSSLSYQANVNKMRSRIVEQVFNNRKYFYRNRVEFYQYQSMVTSLEKSHRHQRRKQIDTRQKIAEDLKQIRSIRYPSSLTTKLFKTKDFYRFGIRVNLLNDYCLSISLLISFFLNFRQHHQSSHHPKKPQSTHRIPLIN